MAFKHISQTSLSDIQSEAHLYEHIETEAQVIHIDNEDQNRAFTIAFKTPVSSDNGVAHVVEHAVLNGSKNYPSKEPFVELIKGSLNTFVNAMTFSDKTMYPVASTNATDFDHLVSVYLDAVFYPLFYDNPQILAQEGWHYHLESQDDDLIYKGVVYNEMKGASSSPERQVSDVLARNMFSDSHYQWNSGGLPHAISTLTQKDFVDFHQTHYHPSNAYVVIYGDVDIDHYLGLLESYFKGFQPQSQTFDLKATPNITTKETIVDTYNVAEGEGTENKDYLALSWYIGGPDEVVDYFGMNVLDEILLGNDQSPLKKAILDAQIGGDVDGGVDDMGHPRLFDIVVKYSQEEKMAQLQDVIETTLKDLVENGIDRALIEAALNKITFQLKETVMSESNPRGIMYAIVMMKQWIYDEEPYSGLEFSKYLSKIESFADQGYFESLIQEKLLNNSQYVKAVLKPQAGKNDQEEAERLAKLQEYKASLSQEELAAFVDKTQALIERQETPDSPENLAKIPTLTRQDLSADTERYPINDNVFEDGSHFYHTPQFTSGIDYVSLYCDLSDQMPEDFTWLTLLASLLGELDTETMAASQLQTQKDIHTGGISARIRVFEDLDLRVKPYFILSGKALEENLDKLASLMHDIMTTTIFDQPNDILHCVHQSLSDFEQKIVYAAHGIATDRVLSQYSAAANLMEYVDGIDYYRFLQDRKQELAEGKADQIVEKLEEMLMRLLNRQRMSLFYCGDANRAEVIKDTFMTKFEDCSHRPLKDQVNYHIRPKANEAYVTSQDVNYVAFANRSLQPFHGDLEVLATLLRFDYLWNNIRVKGGAYGAMYQYRRNGDAAFVSYRDPNISKTLSTYQGVAKYIDTLALSQEELDKNVIGTMSRYTRPLSALDKGMKAFIMYMSGFSYEEEETIKQAIIDTQLSDLQAESSNFQTILDDGTYVVIGNKAQIHQEADLFDEIIDLF